MSQPPRTSMQASLTYARSLRAIGHSLELLGVRCFEIQKNGEEYLVRVTPEPARKGGSVWKAVKRVARIVGAGRCDDKGSSGTKTLGQQLRYTTSDICHLDEQAKSRRRRVNIMPNAFTLSQNLRVIGGYLDRKAARAFNISMSGRCIAVWDESSVGRHRETFDVSNIYDRAIHMCLQRSNRKVTTLRTLTESTSSPETSGIQNSRATAGVKKPIV